MPKRTGAIIPDPVDPPGTRKLVICVPDTVEWLSLVTGCVSQMRYGWYWDRSTGDLDAVRNRAKQMYFEMQDQDGDCMALDCDEVAECIENSDAVKAALTNFLNTLAANGNKISTTNATRGMGDGYNDECDPDIVWSQSVALVTRVNTAIVDLLESVQEGDTIAKLGGIVASFPVVENLGLSSVTSLASFLFNTAIETYLDDYTQTWAETVECEIFCTAKDTCLITFNNVYDIFKTRVYTAVPAFVPPIEFFDVTEWATRLAQYAADLAEVNKADLLFYFIFGGLAYGNVIINNEGIGQRALDIALILASDEPSNDWEVLCTDCAPSTGCHDTESGFAVLIDGDWVEDLPDMRFVRATTNGDVAEFDIVFPAPVQLVSWVVDFQSLGSGTTANAERLSLWLEGVEITVLYTHAANDGGYVWQTHSGGAGGAPTFDTAKFYHTHAGKRADVRGEICVALIP